MSTPPGVLLRDDDFSNKAPPASNVKERASCFMHTDLTPTTRTDLVRHGARWQHRPPSDRVATHEARSMHAMTTSAFATPHRCGSSTRCHRVRRRCPAHQGRRQRRHRRSCCAVLGAGTDVGSRALRPPLGWAACYCNSRPARPVAKHPRTPVLWTRGQRVALSCEDRGWTRSWPGWRPRHRSSQLAWWRCHT